MIHLWLCYLMTKCIVYYVQRRDEQVITLTLPVVENFVNFPLSAYLKSLTNRRDKPMGICIRVFRDFPGLNISLQLNSTILALIKLN